MRTLRRGLLLAMLRSSQFVFLFLSGVVVARALGPELRAEYALTFALGSATWVLIHLSLPEAAGRLLARREASLTELSPILYGASLVLGALGLLAVLFIGVLARASLLQNASTGAIVLGAMIVPLMLVQQMSVGLLTRLGALTAYGWVSAGTGLLQLGLVVLLAASGPLTPENALAAAVVALSARAIAMAIAVARYTGVRGLIPGGSPQLVWRVLKIGLIVHPAYVALALTLRIDLFLVSVLSDARAVGLYSLAASLAEILFLVSWTMTESALKTQTEAGESAAARYTLWVARQVLAITVICAAVVALVAYPMVYVVYGNEWVASVPPLLILTCASVAIALEGPIRIMMIRMVAPSVIAYAAGTGIVVNVLLNLLLIPRLGINGAALASVVSYWLYLWLLLRSFHKATALSVRPIFQRPREGDVIVRIVHGVVLRVRHGKSV
ncbi:MAG: polysaccharide biosynthesis C-terminal domain-containing protein [Solirubrobacteraceae bacterium]